MIRSNRYGYRIAFACEDGEEPHVMIEGRDFHVKETTLCDGLLSSLPIRERDLVRIASGVYFADRMIRRKHASRTVRLDVEVGDVDFWETARTRSLIENAVQSVSDDIWDLTLTAGKPSASESYLPFPHEGKRVCLYSGGLDSAAGLAAQLRTGAMPMLTVTASHQPGQSTRVREQVAVMSQRYGSQVFPLLPRIAMIRPPRMSQQETSQRCRGFLFLAFGGVVAARVGAPQVEIYENGIGALNLPLMTGMLFGSRATKGTHPHFLRLMSDLLSRVSEKRVDFVLPFRHSTKGELVRFLRQDGFDELAQRTISCSHYPIRTSGHAKQCGWCPACIGRRQAMIEAGIDEDRHAYEYDLFGPPDAVNAVANEKLDFIKAHLMQLVQLGELRDDGRKPDILWRHAVWTHFLTGQEPILPWVDLLRRYRVEWLRLVGRGQQIGWRWAAWFSASGAAA